ncbi:MAG: hypothetical protein OEX02_20450, partial [Cyclobacteriaceae bacterium]|nr:hypothetical protein [Cyclobacteriaceae bacterium]
MLKFAGFVILIFILTTLTQTGGLILLCCIPLFRRVDRHVKDDIKRKALKLSLFIAAYLLASVTILPLSARQFGRVPLPVFSNDQLRPLNIFTCVLNRHYVSPRLLRATESVAEELEKLQPGTVLSYLDAGFPFINGFPLLPHLSHDDGEKLDIALMYANSLTNDPTPNDA